MTLSRSPQTTSRSAKKIVIALAACCLIGGGTAVGQDLSPEDLLQCDKIKKSEDRLACFNTIVEKLKEDPEAFNQSARRKGDENESGVRSTERGRDNTTNYGRASRDDRPKRMESGIKRLWQDHYGRWVFYLANGQIWRQDGKNETQRP